jgi:hypothetical protein
MGAPKDPTTLLLQREGITPNEMTTPAKGSGRIGVHERAGEVQIRRPRHLRFAQTRWLITFSTVGVEQPSRCGRRQLCHRQLTSGEPGRCGAEHRFSCTAAEHENQRARAPETSMNSIALNYPLDRGSEVLKRIMSHTAVAR